MNELPGRFTREFLEKLEQLGIEPDDLRIESGESEAEIERDEMKEARSDPKVKVLLEEVGHHQLSGPVKESIEDFDE